MGSLIVFNTLLNYGCGKMENYFIVYLIGVFFSMSAGYFINDYYDHAVDLINHPNRKVVSRKWLLNAYFICVFTVFFLSLFLKYFYQNVHFGVVMISSLVLSWWYSFSLQKLPFIGNFLIAMLVVLLYVPVLIEVQGFGLYRWEIIGFLLLNGLITLSRELVKDAEDKLGDTSNGYRTLPILLSTDSVKRISEVLVITALVVLFISFQWWMHKGIIQLISLPAYALLVGFLFKSWGVTPTQNEKYFFSQQSLRLKWSMFSFLIYVLAGLYF
jgi:4-hydroxybenzoate polyprenyltransferase